MLNPADWTAIGLTLKLALTTTVILLLLCTPLSFYTLLALNRVRENFAGDYDKLLQDLYGEPRPEDETFAFKPRALFTLPGFWRGVELLRLGLGSEAKREWHAVGITVPESKSYQVAGLAAGGVDSTASEQVNEQTERLWLAAVLYDRAPARLKRCRQKSARRPAAD